MSEDVKDLVSELKRELSQLYLILEQCRQLFSDPETVLILNRTSGLFFQIVQSQFFDALLMGIARLTDKEHIGRRRNLSINVLCSLIRDDELKNDVDALCIEAKIKSEFARGHRNKRIAHSDQQYFNARESSHLDTATFAKIESSLKAIEAVIGLVSSRLFKTSVVYKFINLQGSADALVGKLKNLDLQC